MNLSNAIKIILLSTGLTLVCLSSFAQSPTTVITVEGGVGPGGGNDVEAAFAEAKASLYTILTNAKGDDLKKLNDEDRDFIEKEKNKFLVELQCSTIKYDHDDDQPFIQLNGSKTWIETDLNQSCAEIRVRTNIKDYKPPTDVEGIMLFYAHELGHHLSLPTLKETDDEKKAWKASYIIMSLYRVKLKYPDLVGVSGEYEDFQAANSCRNKASVVANPFSGLINVITYSGDINDCNSQKVYSEFGTAIFSFKKNDRYMTAENITSPDENSSLGYSTTLLIIDKNNITMNLVLRSSSTYGYIKLFRSFKKVK